MTTVTSNTVTITVEPAPDYGLVCTGGYYRCMVGHGTSTLAQCEANPDFAKACG